MGSNCKIDELWNRLGEWPLCMSVCVSGVICVSLTDEGR